MVPWPQFFASQGENFYIYNNFLYAPPNRGYKFVPSRLATQIAAAAKLSRNGALSTE